jgi:hypothetical protein
MPRRRRQRTKQTNRTAHQRAIADPQLMSLIRALRRDWKKIGLIERGERLRELAKRGCSTRGLGKELRQSATTVRRHMTLAGLPESEREAVKAGSSAKNILARKATADRRRRMQQRIEEDAQTGELSDRMADTIMAFCRTVDEVPESPIVEGDLSKFLDHIREALRDIQRHGAPGLRLSKKLSPKQRFERTRPQPQADEFWMEHWARWLAILIWSEAREEPIWDRAIEKARRRAKELRIKMTPMERYEERLIMLAKKSASPPRRKY